MEIFDFVFSGILPIVLAAAISLIPITYPKYSWFRRGANTGVEQLKQFDNEVPIDHGELAPGWTITTSMDSDVAVQKQSFLTEKDPGYSQLLRVLKSRHHFDKPVEKLFLVRNEPSGGGIAISSAGSQRLEQAAFGVIFDDGSDLILLEHPYDVERIVELRDLKEWIDTTAKRRSHFITITLVLFWTSVMIGIQV